MKKTILSIVFLISFTLINAQKKVAIANFYIKRANTAIESSLDYKAALSDFENALENIDTISDRKIASLGSSIYFELHLKKPTIEEKLEFLKKAKEYSDLYFSLFEDVTSEEYNANVPRSIKIMEATEVLEEELEKKRLAFIKKQKELKRIDSLKTVWQNKYNSLVFEADSIYKFNKNNIALYSKNGFFGIINDVGDVLFEADEYKDALVFDGYIILKNRITEPTKLYSFNTNNSEGFLLPRIADFNALSTHYGAVMLPRGNGILVTYPNNSYEPFIYDLNAKNVVKFTQDLQDLFKNLKKADKIDKYNKDDQIKIGKNWYNFGGHIGGGVYPLYETENPKLFGFLCALDGSLLQASSGYKAIGTFYNNNFQAISDTESFWINQNGTKLNQVREEAKDYSGNSEIKKLDSGGFHIIKEGVIILGEEKLENRSLFLQKFPKK
ncbi:hypothetical protein K8354_13525 [Polaribacter litorisediminis]|uniref:hypothetical protein n=1 Tax=Polaribacter litorisediminis TaxID=1908341 RepID=UPI001CBB429E|nr:hypothetical protein [Polaribacter litorisediminis]UAM97333.1 hypothetical protein K8354_13525 [Polaribacter litorisediminis]